MKKLFAHISIAFFAVGFVGIKLAHAQASDKFIRKGNKLYERRNYTDAEAEYKKALSKDDKSSTGFFNLGNSLYEQKRYEQAMEQYAASVKNSTTPSDQAAAQYNIGNTYMTGKKWEDAIAHYKQSLIKNPEDNEARYNLAYAQAMLKKQQNGGGGKNNDQKNKDKNKDQKNKDQQNQNNQDKNKDKDQQNKDQQDQNKNNKDDQDQQQQHPQPQPSDISQQRADQLLNAAAQAEKKIRQDKDKKDKGVSVYKGKGW